MKRLTILIALLLSLLTSSLVSTQATTTGSITTGANLRTGPGTTYTIAGKATKGQTVVIVGQNATGDWYQLEGGQWIAAFLVTVAEPVAPPAGQAAQVTNIVDGDTIDVTINQQTYRVRYILINTPETGQTYFTEATEANRQLVAGKTVYLVKDVNETDRYGRLLRYVYLADGTFVNRELVRLGFAALATFPPDVSKETEIRAAQQEAVAAGRGLWADAADVPVVPAPTQAASQPTATPVVIPPTATPQPVAPTATPLPPAAPAQPNCDPSYPDFCLEPGIPDLDCKDIPYGKFRVLPPDPHGFDGNDNDGLGCESN